MNGAMSAAMPGAQARDEAARHGGVPGSSVNGAASERFESEAASDRIANAGPADGPSTSTGMSDEPSADRLAAFGQRDVECSGGLNGVVVKEFVEIAHAVEEQGTRVAFLQRVVLCHDRRVAVGNEVFSSL